MSSSILARFRPRFPMLSNARRVPNPTYYNWVDRGVRLSSVRAGPHLPVREVGLLYCLSQASGSQ